MHNVAGLPQSHPGRVRGGFDLAPAAVVLICIGNIGRDFSEAARAPPRQLLLLQRP